MFTVYLFRIILVESGNNVENRIGIASKEVYKEHPMFDPISVIDILPDFDREYVCISYVVRLVTKLPEEIVMQILGDVTIAAYQNHVKSLDRLLA
jgi:hypothetical protein